MSINLIIEQLNDFSSISLQEIQQVELMNRTDTKFVLHQETLLALLQELNNEYAVLRVNDQPISNYESIYFDTTDLKFYHDHHNGKRGRSKVRMRKYVESNLIFLEVKQKDKKQRTVKSRIRLADYDTINSSISQEFIQKTLDFSGELKSTLKNKFRRVTLVDNALTERITIDLDMSFRQDDKERFLNDLVVIEVKQDGVNRSSSIMKVLKKSQFRPFSISKYCVGLASLCEELKQNMFKEKLLMIEKITN